mgnify:CR=1 FL=1
MASAGVASRRQCEEYITAGRVEVDRVPVTELGHKVDPEQSEIRVDGEPIKSSRRVYYAVNKPPGVVCTNDDPSGRVRVIDLLPPSSERVYTVGRLDQNSEGLILVTNDGWLAQQLTHPRFGVEKVYHVHVAGTPDPEAIASLERGVHLAEGAAKAERVTIKRRHKQSTVLEMVLREGRNREIRRLLARIGHKVMSLRRMSVGNVRLGRLEVGEVRRLRPEEITKLRQIANMRRDEADAPGRKPRRPSKRSAKRAAPHAAKRSGKSGPSPKTKRSRRGTGNRTK